MNDTRDLSLLDRLIVGRVTPHIYAFTTGTIPNYLKVGDTYRTVERRLGEWRRHFPDLNEEKNWPATIDEDVYFRDYSVHSYLEEHLGLHRLTRRELPSGSAFSNEFFQGATTGQVDEAIDDIHRSVESADGRYTFYDANTALPQQHRYIRSNEPWELRPNQKRAVENFVNAVSTGRTNLLMYAVMRFGKSFTSLECAKAMNARTVLIVSAKADVEAEWKKTTEIPQNFTAFQFLNRSQLDNDPRAIEKIHEAGGTAVIFLTLQDLQGDQIKERHKQFFSTEEPDVSLVDLLIIDESHYGARAEEYGKVLRDVGLPVEDAKNLKNELTDTVDTAEAEAVTKVLKAKVRLHLSGTPYRILMGSEFEPEDIIAFVQFTDIVREQEQWDAEHLQDDDVNEWDNPYFGFPQMVRFAFNLNESSRKKLSALGQQGETAALSALFEPESVKRDRKTKGHTRFKHAAEVLDLLRVIDGTQDDEAILGFLDDDRIKDGHMCRHVVMVLPYRASCDAMEALIVQNSDEFKNLSQYSIINISGLDGPKQFRTTESVKNAIAKAEQAGEKTITLTVNRMLTGSTVEQWDTMLFLKETSSPQEYDQAIYRLQNQYIRELRTTDDRAENEYKVIRECLKPQTILVDFDPTRMFRLQEQRSLFYNVNTHERGNDQLEDRIREELRISPIVTLNANKIHEVQPTDILHAVSNYNANRSVNDEVMDLPVDLAMLTKDEHLRRLIERQAEIGSKDGLDIPPHDGDGEDLGSDDPDGRDEGKNKRSKDKETGKDQDQSGQEDEARTLAKKIQTYYQRILFFAMLAQCEVSSLGDIIERANFRDHRRILTNLNLNIDDLKLIKKYIDPFKLSQLDYKIQNINRLGRDESLTPIERAQRAIGKFSRLSDSEVRTPAWLCEEMLNQIPANSLTQAVRSGYLILDIASKFGEFALASYRRLVNDLDMGPDEIRNAILSIPTSRISYEFTRRFYEILGLNENNIASNFTSHDLLQKAEEYGLNIDEVCHLLRRRIALVEMTLDSLQEEREPVQFIAVTGNPPYQKNDGGNGRSASPIYPHFVELANRLTSEYSSLVIPARWYSGGKGLSAFRDRMLTDKHIGRLVDYPNSLDVFSDADIAGGICYFLRDSELHEKCETILIRNGEPLSSFRALDEFDTFIRHPLAVSIIEKVQANARDGFLDMQVSARKPFGLATTVKPTTSGDIKLLHREGIGCFRSELVTKNRDKISTWKVMLSYLTAEHAGQPDKQGRYRVLSRIEVLPPGTVCTETYLTAGMFESELEARHLEGYLKTKTVRFLILQRAISQHITRDMFNFVPRVDLSRSWSDDALYAYFGFSENERLLITSLIRAY